MRGVNPDPDVDLAVGEFTEHHPDFGRTDLGHQPGSLLGRETRQCAPDFVAEVAGRDLCAVPREADVLGAGREDVAVLLRGERPQHQSPGPPAGRLRRGENRRLTAQVLQFSGDAAARHLGEPIERQPQHSFGRQSGGVEQICDGVDRGVVVLRGDHCVEDLVATVQRAHQGIGDGSALSAGLAPGHVLGHGQQAYVSRRAPRSVQHDQSINTVGMRATLRPNVNPERRSSCVSPAASIQQSQSSSTVANEPISANPMRA